MEYGDIQHFLTGVAIPLSGIKTHQSLGIGEITDLPQFALWSKKCGLDLIQLLPINDTGFSASPYSALSAFALNPIYLHLDSIPEISPFLSEIRIFREQMSHCEAVPYVRIYDFKTRILRQVFLSQFSKIQKSRNFKSFLKSNTWLITYSVYSALKESQGQKAWFHWDAQFQQMDNQARQEYFDSNPQSCLFFAWVQYLIEDQWQTNIQLVAKHGVKIKGDIPILINEDSADAWAYSELFDSKTRAGAPPDMFSKTGQNWGFPCYNWKNLESSNYEWWRERIRQSNKFFHAIRIDHVLGFFRIWKIPSTEQAGILGQFNPSVGLRSQQIQEFGLSHLPIERFVEPHFKWDQLNSIFSELHYDWTHLFYEKEGFFRFKPEFYNEHKLIEIAADWKALRSKLLECYWSRLLIPYGSDFTPYWYWYDNHSFHTLSAEEQNNFSNLAHHYEAQQDELWYQEGFKILSMMKEETNMLVCAEDLGAVPHCVPKALSDLNILGLKIERWAKDYGAPNEPFIQPNRYPRNSVCTPSCHDTSTLRGWWDDKTWNHRQYLDELGWQDDPDYLTSELCEAIILRNLLSNSLLAIFPLQDWLALSYPLRTLSSEEERINVPGTVNETNWNWRMKPFLEDLLKEEWIQQKIFDLIQQRKNRVL